MKTRKTGRRLFIVILAIHSLIAFGLGLTSLIDFSYAIETGFQIPYESELEIFGMTMGLELMFLTAMAVLSIFWLSKNKIEGATTGMAVGIYLLVYGVFAFLKFGDPQALYVDSVRGALTVLFGYLAVRELKQVKQHERNLSN